jgi:hypothetical protein
MLINSVPVEVVGAAYQIAANYLSKIGLIPAMPEIHEPLFDAIVQEYKTGTHNNLKLASRAITRIEKRLTLLN